MDISAIKSSVFPCIDVEYWCVAWETNINARDRFGRSFLSFSLDYDLDKKIIFKILDQGVDVNALDRDGCSPLVCVLNKESCDIDVFDKLIDFGADVNAEDILFMTPLKYALQKNPDLYIIDKLLDHGADINHFTSDPNVAFDSFTHTYTSGYTPLMKALAYKCHISIVDKLLQRGADVNLVIPCGISPLAVSIVHQCNVNIISRLIEEGADVTARDKFNQTPLLLAVQYYPKKEVISLLISKGANVRDVTSDGDNILHLIRDSDPEVINFLEGCGVPLEAENRNGETPLLKAALTKVIDHSRESTLDCSVVLEFEKIENLLAVGCDPNSTDNKLNTMLHCVCMNVFCNYSFNIMIYHGANLNAINSYNEKPFNVMLNRDFYDDDFRYKYEYDVQPVYLENLEAVVKNLILILGEHSLSEYLQCLPATGFSYLETFIREFVEKCKLEIKKMRMILLSSDFTFYDFCILKRFKHSQFLNIPNNDYKYDYYDIVDLFPLYHDLIILRIHDNRRQKSKKDLIKKFDNLLLCSKTDHGDNGVLITYDSIFLMCQFLNHKQVYNLFLASL